MLYLWTTAKAKWLLVALLLFCMHLHETKSIVYFDHFWCRLKRTMNKWILNYLWKLCWILVGMFNEEFHFVTYIKNFPRYSQRLFAFGFLPCFFLNFLCRQFDVFYFQPKTIPFCKMIIMTFSKQHTSCIWTAQYFFFYCSSKVQNNFIKMTKNRKW